MEKKISSIIKMFNPAYTILQFCFSGIFTLIFSTSFAQNPGCNLLPPVVNIDFGSNTSQPDWRLSPIKNYTQVSDNCPDDGYVSVTNYLLECFSGHWHNLSADHTPGDENGKMLIVNASHIPGLCFMVKVGGLKPGATYQLSSYIMNVCKVDRECVNIPPLLEFRLLSGDKIIKRMVTGNIYPGASPEWKPYAGFFQMPANESTLTLQVLDKNPGGCGNDFAMDDISFRECVTSQTVNPPVEKNRIDKITPGKVLPNVEQKNDPEIPVVKRSSETGINTVTVTSKVPDRQIIATPEPIARRANPVIKRIVTTAAEMIIQLYDNGQIDGDTISVYHNNELVLSKAGLSAKPLVLKINIDEAHPQHELIMVAENLGSIPPNTSLMIATANGKRYEVHISSSQEKNARIIIDLKE